MRRRVWVYLALIVALLLPAPAIAVLQNGHEASAPAVSELDKLRLENVALSEALAQTQGLLQVCQAQLAPQTFQQTTKELAAKRQAIVTEFETAHPGWTLDPKTGAVTKK